MKSIILCNVIFIIILIVFFIDIDQYIPDFNNYLALIWIVMLGSSVYKSMTYLKNKPESEIRLRSKNETYFNLIPFIFGVLACFLAIVFFFASENGKTLPVLFFISGLLLLLWGVIIIPSVLIKKENDNLYFENGKQKISVEIEQI